MYEKAVNPMQSPLLSIILGITISLHIIPVDTLFELINWLML